MCLPLNIVDATLHFDRSDCIREVLKMSYHQRADSSEEPDDDRRAATVGIGSADAWFRALIMYDPE